MTRPPWNVFFMQKAQLSSTRGTCLRRRVGACLTDPHHVGISEGYNGSPPGEPHCTDEGVGCDMINDHCERTLHAEMNAMLFAERRQLQGGYAYLYNASPCMACAKALRTISIRYVYFSAPDIYNAHAIRFLESRGAADVRRLCYCGCFDLINRSDEGLLKIDQINNWKAYLPGHEPKGNN